MIVLDLFFPKFCISCKKWRKYICLECRRDIEVLPFHICPVCNEKIYPGLIHKECEGKVLINGVVSCMKYNKVAKKIVKAIKYQLIYDIYTELSEFIYTKGIFQEFYKRHNICYFQPIPLHPNRLKLRGFNQAEELATLFSKKFPYRLINALLRVKDTKPQAQIHYKKQRQENIHNAFNIKDNGLVKGKVIILVDDVYTSGTTCLEAAKILKNNGVLEVYVWSLARD